MDMSVRKKIAKRGTEKHADIGIRMGVGEKVNVPIFTKKHKHLKHTTRVQAEVRVRKVIVMITQTTADTEVIVKNGLATETIVMKGRGAEVGVK